MTAVWFAGLLFAAQLAQAGDLRLLDAVKRHDSQAAASLLAAHADVNGAAADGSTPLMWAAHWDDLATADLLLKAGAKVDAANELGVTALALACSNGNAGVVSRLLTAGANPNLTPLSGESPLMSCVAAGNAQAVKALLDHHAQLNQKSGRYRQTALMWALAKRQDEIARILIEHGADPAARSDGGFTPLLFAAQQGDIEAAKMLLAKGASIKDSTPEFGNALVVASAGGHEEMAIWLLDQGADPNSADSSGMTALHFAMLRGLSRLVGLRVELIQEGYMFRSNMEKLIVALLEHHANPNVRLSRLSPALPTGNGWAIDPTGATPFLLSVSSLDIGTMQALLKSGADPSIATKENNTALMLAAGLGLTKDRSESEEAVALQAVKILSKLGANVNAADTTGQTALHGAAYIGADAIIQFLAQQGAKIDSKDSYGMTPMSIAEGIAPPDLKDIDKNPKIAHKNTVALLRKLGNTEPSGQD